MDVKLLASKLVHEMFHVFANMTRLTSRTIRNYLKNGSLTGKKVGGQWRFTEEDIKKLFGYGKFIKTLSNNCNENILSFMNGNDTLNVNVEVCCIVNYMCKNEQDAFLISKKISDYICKNEETVNDMIFNYIYLENKKKARFTFFGKPCFITKMLDIIQQQ